MASATLKQEVQSALKLLKEQNLHLSTAWEKALEDRQSLITACENWATSLEMEQESLDKERKQLTEERVELEKQRQELVDEQKGQDKLSQLEHELRQQQAILDQQALEYEERIRELEVVVPQKVQKLREDSAVKEIVRFNVLGQHCELPMSLVERSDVLRMLVTRRSTGDLDPDGRFRLVYSPQKFQVLVEYLLSDPEPGVSPSLPLDIADYFGISDCRSNCDSDSNVSFSKERITFTPHRWDKHTQFCGFCGNGPIRRVCSICHLCQRCDSRNCSCFRNRMSAHMLIQNT